MKKFIQFKQVYSNGEIVDAMGSDSIFILDGRNNINTMKKDAEKRIKQLKNVQIYKYYEIRAGNIRNSIVLFQNY